MANPVPAGSDVSSGTYRCTSCGREMDVGSTKSPPPCPSCGDGAWETVSGGDSVRDPSRPLVPRHSRGALRICRPGCSFHAASCAGGLGARDQFSDLDVLEPDGVLWDSLRNHLRRGTGGILRLEQDHRKPVRAILRSEPVAVDETRRGRHSRHDVALESLLSLRVVVDRDSETCGTTRLTGRLCSSPRTCRG